LIQKPETVGSEEYNAPELFEDHVAEGSKSHSSAQYDEFYYDGSKADVFSAGVTLFLMLTKSSPFRSAHLKDPYFRRLSSVDKKAFWKIFSGTEISELGKDLFERMTEKDPKARLSIADIKGHPWLKGEVLDESLLASDLDIRSETL
jgi:serine/threonine protein kinase